MTSDHQRPHDSPSGDDLELRQWIEDWGGEDPAPPSAEERQRLRRGAHRFGLGLVWLTVFEVLICLGMGFWITHMAWSKGSSDLIALAVLVWPLVIVGEGLALWNRRGTWRPHNDSVRAFVELEQLRVERQLFSATRLMPGIYIAELLLIVPWKWWSLMTHQPEDAERLIWRILGIVAGMSLALFAGLVAWRRRMLERREDLARLAESLEAEDPPTGTS